MRRSHVAFDAHEPGDWDEDLAEDELKGEVVCTDEAPEPLKHGIDEGNERDDGDQVGADIRNLQFNIKNTSSATNYCAKLRFSFFTKT